MRERLIGGMMVLGEAGTLVTQILNQCQRDIVGGVSRPDNKKKVDLSGQIDLLINGLRSCTAQMAELPVPNDRPAPLGKPIVRQPFLLH